jgi:ribonuclease VapC
MSDFAVDTSVLVAILKGEEEAIQFEAVLARSSWIIGWPAVLELQIWMLRNSVIDREGFVGLLQDDPAISFVDFNRDLQALAAQAYERFGKGRHPAKLNYGDCMAYAVAKHHDLPLLFKGADFGLTDLKAHPTSVLAGLE